MKEVTKEQFFEVIGPMDVHPSIQEPNETHWKTKNGQIVGLTIPGWRNGYTDGKKTPRQYFLNTDSN